MLLLGPDGEVRRVAREVQVGSPVGSPGAGVGDARADAQRRVVREVEGWITRLTTPSR